MKNRIGGAGRETKLQTPPRNREKKRIEKNGN